MLHLTGFHTSKAMPGPRQMWNAAHSHTQTAWQEADEAAAHSKGQWLIAG